MEIGDNLNEENIWGKMREHYPNAMDDFGDWMDKYKERVKWKTMFFKTKFHDIPAELQFGVMIQYFFEKKMIDGMTFDMDRSIPTAINIKTFAKQIDYYFNKLENRLK